MRLIDADALIVEIKNCLWDWESVNGITAKTVLTQTMTDIGNMPTIDPVRHGKWIFENRTWFHQPLLKCSCCGRRQFVARFDYCPYCGARMERNDNGET